MGAHDISFELDGSKTFSQVKEAFRLQRENDRDYNGHREGYSGDFQTVSRVVDHSHMGVFADHSKAFDYCLKHAQKWESVIAVKYKVIKNLKLDAKHNRLRERLQRLTKAWNEATVAKEFDAGKRSEGKTFVTCQSCKARLPVKFQHYGQPDTLGNNCPVCGSSFASKRAQAKVVRAYEAKEKAKKDLADHEAALRNKQGGEAKWLICGWGAS